MLFSHEQWAELRPLLPTYKPSKKGGRPRLKIKKITEGIFYILENRIPWKSAPREFGSGTALNDYFRDWARLGLFHDLRKARVLGAHYYKLDWDRINKQRDGRST